MSNTEKDPAGRVIGIIACVVFLIVTALAKALMPTAGVVTSKEIVPAEITYEYAPAFGDDDGHYVPVHRPTAFRIHIRTESGWINHFDVPESIYRTVKVGTLFDSKRMELPDSG